MSYNREQFIEKARTKHGNKYDYSKVNYINSLTKVNVICPVHGEFKVAPGSHLYGIGCKHCGFEKSRKASSDNQVTFIQKAKAKHGDRYDYTRTIYKDSLTPILIYCKKHKTFFNQQPASHIRGRGCPKCGFEKGSELRSYTAEEFIEKIKSIQGNLWDYSQLEYKGFDTKVKLICKEHGEFYKNPRDLISKITGCSKCSGNHNYSTEEFIEKANINHNNKYDYSKAVYTKAYNKVIITCPIHGNFEQKAYSHLQGCGCPICDSSKGEEQIFNYLKELGIFAKREYKISTNDYKYDFFLPFYNIFIEFHGRQHYEYSPFFHESKEHFFKRFLDDKEKEELVRQVKGKLIIVNYIHLEKGILEQYLKRQLIRYGVLPFEPL